MAILVVSFTDISTEPLDGFIYIVNYFLCCVSWDLRYENLRLSSFHPHILPYITDKNTTDTELPNCIRGYIQKFPD
jgi:hypothetical protein